MQAAWAQYQSTASQGAAHATKAAEVELVEDFVALEQRLDSLPDSQRTPEVGLPLLHTGSWCAWAESACLQVVQPLLRQLSNLLDDMPQDLQDMMLSTPSRAALMQGLQ